MSAPDEYAGKPIKIPGKDSGTGSLAKRFYENATVVSAAPEAGFAILLDGRPVRTPGKRPLTVPTQALAESIAAEWGRQGEKIDPATMPLTKIAISAIDTVSQARAAVARDIVKYAGSDLICYRAEGPEGLIQRQAEVWDPLVDWAGADLGVRLALTKGVMPVAQEGETHDRVAEAVAPCDDWALTCLHVMTTLTGSALLALAHLKGRLSAEEAWAAAHVDEDWQISQWGEDSEAAARLAQRWAEMQGASAFLKLLGQD